ncbi:MSHA biogenesis protein MshQ [Thermotomaculum hydrothermale]|uniref:MSHA biogenesis protein MshQ n=1 Tax=Thermotomaculum hydrothermale TaxID=981385 RepID=A0A7R6PQ08_9BACT|nr:LamG domain-containing protein [Thermotomaculum hydrothermale]BBB32246.1 MSHA biogenesis protein MshQ [Thermotomaculum hydrothermale]
MKKVVLCLFIFLAINVFAQSYIYDDSVNYDWIEIDGTGTEVSWDNQCTYYPDDDDKVIINIGFDFYFGCTSYNQVIIGSNGFLQFGNDTGFFRQYNNTSLPVTSNPPSPPSSSCPSSPADNFIAAYWDDLDPGSGGKVYYQTMGSVPNRIFIVEFYRVKRYGGNTRYTFEVILYEKTGDIKCQYKENCTGNSATVGVEIDDNDYIQYLYNENKLNDEEALMFYNTCLPYADYHFDGCYWEDGEAEVLDSRRDFNGTPYNVSTVDDGVICRSADFTADSTSDYISLPNTVLDGANDVSVSFWIKTGYTGAQAIVSAANSTVTYANEFLIYFSNSTRLYIYIKGAYAYTTVNDIADNQWHHFTVVREGTDVYIYQDGSLIAHRTNAPGGALNVEPGGLIIGQEQDSVGGSFQQSQDCQGYVDELLFFRRSLSSSEVQSIYNNQSNGNNWNGDSRTCPNCSPIADWHLDECFWGGSTGEVIDYSGNNYNGTANGDAFTSNALLCYGGNFDGDGDYVEIPSNSDLEPTEKLTICAWIKKSTADTSGLQNIFTNGGWFRALRLSDNNVLFQLRINGTDQYLYSSTQITDTNWHHLVGVYNGSKMKLYIDGNLDATLDVSGSIDQGNYLHCIGSEYGGYYFSGQIDEVMVFETSLSSSKVQELYNNQLSNLNWDGTSRNCVPCSADIEYRMDECLWDGTANEIVDSSGNGHDGQSKNGANIETDDSVICRSGNFSDDNYGVISGTGYTLSLPYTVTCWIKFPLNAPSPHSQYYVLGSINGDGDLVVFYNSGSSVRWGIWNQNRQWETNSLADNLSGWHHIAVVVTSSGSKMYLDGNYVNSVSLYSIGALYYLFTSSDDLNGQTIGTLVDEFKIFGYALSDSQIAYIYNNESSGINYDGTSRDCNGCSNVSYIEITHDGSGIVCYPERVHIRICDSGGNTVTNYTGTITLTTSTGHGTWYSSYTGVTNDDPPQGTLTDNTSDDGQATYQFVAADEGEVTLFLRDTHLETLTIYATDGSADSTGHDSGALVFRASGFVFDSIANQISGKDFSVTVKAVGEDPETGDCTILDYDGTKTITAYVIYQNPSTGSTDLKINGTDISSSGTNISLNFSNGQCTFTANYPDAGQISIRFTDSAEDITGDSNLFVVKPFGFYVSATGNPGASDASGAVFKKAGEQFELVVKAVNWQSADDSDNDGVPDDGADLSDNSITPNYSETVNLISSLVAPSGGASGTLSPTSLNLSGGQGSDSIMTFTEVGIITITATDSDYLGAGSINGNSGNVGRFIPDSFRFDNVTQNPACSSVFTYGGQNFTVDVSLSAVNSNGDITQNYTGDFAKLDFSGLSCSAIINSSTSGDGTLNVNSTTINFNNGQTSFTLPCNYNWSDEHNPENLAIKITATDSDNVSGEGISNYVPFRYGRLRVENGYAPSADQSLTLNVFAEYYQDGDYLLNSDDNCTTYTDSDVSLSNYSGNLDAGETSIVNYSTISNGEGSLTLSPPGVGNEGTVDLIFSAPYYMHFASGRATFGIYRGNDNIISWEELF